MNSLTIALFCSLLGSALALPPLARAACNADNCARAVTGSALPSASRSAHLTDCQSYLACTVTTTSAGKAATNCPTAVPTYANVCSGGARFSSACSCFGATATTATVTASPSASPTSDCTAIPTTIEGPDIAGNYDQYFSGHGVSENPSNPGNEEFAPPITLRYDASLPKCSAATRCAGIAAEANYFSFDLHRVTKPATWECVLYDNGNNNASYFNVANSSIAEVYGYNFFATRD